jgi:NAD-dependent SIR2 family protein deacetylase
MSQSIFFILGAGASVDSNLPTYRGPNGMYTKSPVDPAVILTAETMHENPRAVWDFLKPYIRNYKLCKSLKLSAHNETTLHYSSTTEYIPIKILYRDVNILLFSELF